MYINQRRIINVDSVLAEFKHNDEVRIILGNPKKFTKELENIGFSSVEIGDSVLPKIIGSATRYNAEGRYELLRNLPKEEYCVDRDFTFLAYGKHEMTKTVTFTYHRYQRKLISAPAQELSIILDKDENKILSSDLITYSEDTKPLIKHIINMFLEIFGECQLVDKDLISRIRTPIRKLNWTLLPKGTMSKEKLEETLSKITNMGSNTTAREIYSRINYINSFKPDFFATGNGGFNEYIVLGFEEKKLFVLENRKPRNATYIFTENWEEITRLTKADILREGHQEHRLLHNSNWKERLKQILTADEQ